MGERAGRAGWCHDDLDDPPYPEERSSTGRDRRLGRLVAGPLMLIFSVSVLYLAWWISWERSHPASAAVRDVRWSEGTRRLEAIRRLETIGAQDPEVAVPALIAALDDADPRNRTVAAEAVATVLHGVKITDADPVSVNAAVAALLARLEDREAAVRARAAMSLLSVALLWPGMPRIVDVEAVSIAFARLADDTNAEVRVAAVRGLGLMGHWLESDPPARLVAALRDESEAVRSAASQELGFYRRGLIRLLPTLVKAMETARPEYRPAYLGLFRSLSPRSNEPAGEVLAAVVAALDSRDVRVRCRMLAILGEYRGQARPHLAAMLAQLDEKRAEVPSNPGTEGPGDPNSDPSDNDPVVAAATALPDVAGIQWDYSADRPRAIPPAREVLPPLLGLLSSRVAARRLAAINALNAFEPDRDQVAALVPLCRDPDARVRAAAIQALGNNASGHRFLTSTRLLAALEDPAARVRAAAATAAPESVGVESMITALIRHAESDTDASVRSDCAWAMASLGPPRVSKAIVPLCVAAIGRSDGPLALKSSMAQVLGRFGHDARPAVPALVRIVQSGKDGPRRSGAVHLTAGVNLHSRAITDAKAEAMRSFEEGVQMRIAATEALGRIAPGSPEAAEAVRGLGAALKEVDEVARSAVAALALFGPEARAALPELAEALRLARAQKQILRAGAIADAMGRIGPNAPESAEAIDFLVEIVKGEDVTPRPLAERLLSRFGPAAVEAVPRMVELSRRPFLRKTEEIGPLAVALSQIAPGTAEEGPALAALVDLVRRDATAQGAEAVITALSRFGPVAVAASPRLRELAGASNPRIRAAVRQALASIEPEAARSPVGR